MAQGNFAYFVEKFDFRLTKFYKQNKIPSKKKIIFVSRSDFCPTKVNSLYKIIYSWAEDIDKYMKTILSDKNHFCRQNIVILTTIDVSDYFGDGPVMLML